MFSSGFAWRVEEYTLRSVAYYFITQWEVHRDDSVRISYGQEMMEFLTMKLMPERCLSAADLLDK